MNNIKVSGKLMIGFTIVILLSTLVGGLGYYGMSTMNTGDDNLYHYNIRAIEQIGDIRTNLQIQRVHLRNAVLYEVTSEEYKTAVADITRCEQEMLLAIADYKPTISLPEDVIEFGAFESLYTSEFDTDKKNILRHLTSGNKQTAIDTMNKATAHVDAMTTMLDTCFKLNRDEAKNRVEENTQMFQRFAAIQLALIVVAVLAAVLMAFYLNSLISKPLNKMLLAAQSIAMGNVDVDIDTKGKDEVGALAEAFRHMASRIKEQAQALSHIAEGDLSLGTQAVNLQDTVGKALDEMTGNLNHIVYEILAVAGEVSSGAVMVSEGSQSLAQGSSEQATAIEQLSSSIFEISLNTKENAKLAAKASELYATIKKRAQEGATLMSDMMRAVQEINQASSNISKIIRLINDISFQTNILSINAAVEAANAGQHGKGFAVVAGEVRNLAAKSAQAATDTDALIENSLDKARLGASIAQQTHDSLTEIVESILQSAELLDDIAKASSEQSLGIEQVNVGIEQVAQVINLNSITAEKSATAAEQMAAQAATMEKLVSNFKLRGSVAPQSASDRPPRPSFIRDEKKPPKPVIRLDDGFGKY